MASDEAVLRIIVTGSAAGPTPTAPSQPAATTPTSTALTAQPGQSTTQQQTPTPPPKPPPQPSGAPARDWVNDLVKGVEGANRHVLIEGQSGSGKSLLTKHIAFQRMQAGEEVHVVDPHTPEAWGGAKQVFQGETAGVEAAEFLKSALVGRKKEMLEARGRGETPDFKPMTVVFSDFARMMKDSPALAEEFRTLLTEARKFRISIVADTTALTVAATGIRGIQDVRQNFAQQVKLYAPTPTEPQRTAEVGGEQFPTPVLPEYKERTDYGLIRPPAPPPPPSMKEEDRQQRLLEMEARAYLETTRKQQAAAEEARRAEVALSDKKQRELELEARAHLEAVRKQQMAAEAAIPVVEKAFDPQEAARRRREGERQQAQVNAAYKQQYGNQGGEGGFDQLLQVAGALRGTIGGLAGTLVGAAMDVAVGFRKVIIEMGRSRYTQQLLAEAVVPVAAGSAGKAAGSAVAEATTSGAATAGAATAGAGAATTGAAAGAEASGGAAAAGAAMSIPVAGAVVAAFAVTVGAAVLAVKVFADALDSAAKKYGQYSPDVALAQAQADVRTTLGDIRRSQQIGPQLAKFVEAQSKATNAFEDVKASLLTEIAPAITGILEIITAIAKILNTDLSRGMISGLLGPMNTGIGLLSRLVSNTDKDDIKIPTDILFSREIEDIRFGD